MLSVFCNVIAAALVCVTVPDEQMVREGFRAMAEQGIEVEELRPRRLTRACGQAFHRDLLVGERFLGCTIFFATGEIRIFVASDLDDDFRRHVIEHEAAHLVERFWHE